VSFFKSIKITAVNYTVLSCMSSSAFGLRRYYVAAGGGGGDWIGDEKPAHVGDSILLYYDFEDGANDASGNGNHGTVIGNAIGAGGVSKNGTYGAQGDGNYTTSISQMIDCPVCCATHWRDICPAII
jgi:hypothetical protein